MADLMNIFAANWIFIVITVAVSYLLGSINPAIIVTRLVLHKDIREMGSGNAGFTNVLRSVGKGPAIMTIVFDFFKGAFAAFLGGMVFASFVTEGSAASATEILKYGSLICGAFAILGHMFPVYFKFKGGKGVATAAAVILVTDVRVCGMMLLTFGLGFIVTKIISIGSIIASISYPIYTFLFLYFSDYLNPPEPYVPVSVEYIVICTVVAAILAALVIAKHKSNIVRIFNGTEKKIAPKSRPKKGKRLGSDE